MCGIAEATPGFSLYHKIIDKNDYLLLSLWLIMQNNCVSGYILWIDIKVFQLLFSAPTQNI